MIFDHLPKNSAFIRHFMNCWPPFLFAGIKLVKLSPDFKYCLVKLKDWPGTRTVNGAQYGGSLFAMTDPIYSIMLLPVLGKKYYVWDKAEEIEFIKPGRGKVYFECKVSDEFLADVQQKTAGGDKYFPLIKNRLYDDNGDTVAAVTKTLYIRLKAEYRPVKQQQ